MSDKRVLGKFGKGIKCHASQPWPNSISSEKPSEAFEWRVERWHALWEKKKKMKPGGYLEDDWKQVVLCHWTHFSVHQSENKPSICQWGNSDPIRNGTLIAFFFITEDEVTNSDFYLPAQDAWLPESSHLKIGSWKASIFDIFMSKTLI